MKSALGAHPGSCSVGTGASVADYSSPFSVELKNEWIYISTPPHVFMCGVSLISRKITEVGLLGFWTLSVIQYSKEHKVSETGRVPVLKHI
jgi:hypothetical protein